MGMRAQRFALITGAATRIGRALSIRLAAEGFAIGLHYHHSEAEAVELAKQLEANQHTVFLLPADLTQEDEVLAMFSKIQALGVVFEVLVNSAAVMFAGNLKDLEVETWDQTFALNLRAPWLCAREAARLMADRGGIIINISDSGANRSWPGYGAYVVSKAGVESLTGVLARSLAPKIRVNAVAPGLILKADGMSEDQWNHLVNRLPLQQAGAPRDIENAVLFLITNPHITGTTLVVDGGYQLL